MNRLCRSKWQILFLALAFAGFAFTFSTFRGLPTARAYPIEVSPNLFERTTTASENNLGIASFGCSPLRVEVGGRALYATSNWEVGLCDITFGFTHNENNANGFNDTHLLAASVEDCNVISLFNTGYYAPYRGIRTWLAGTVGTAAYKDAVTFYVGGTNGDLCALTAPQSVAEHFSKSCELNIRSWSLCTFQIPRRSSLDLWPAHYSGSASEFNNTHLLAASVDNGAISYLGTSRGSNNDLPRTSFDSRRILGGQSATSPLTRSHSISLSVPVITIAGISGTGGGPVEATNFIRA